MAAGVSATVVIPQEEIDFTETVLGEGAFATVYKATWRGAVVAVKCIRALTHGESPSSEKRQDKAIVEAVDVFRKEASLSCGLLHPRIVRFFGVYAPDTRHVGLVMELMETSLRNRVLKDPALTTPCIVHVLQDMTSALIYLHSRNILHRDISPRNTLLLDDSAERRLIAKLADFATAKAVETIGFDRHSSIHIGTLSYLPYEAIDKDPVTDALVYSSAVDVYSVGAVGLFSVLRKEPSGTPRAKPRYLERVGSTHALHGLLEKCLADDPRMRPSSMKLLADLGRVHVSEPCTCSDLPVRLQETATKGTGSSERDGAMSKLHAALEMEDLSIAAAIARLQVAREELEERNFIEKVRMYNEAMESPNCNGALSNFPQWQPLTTIPLPPDIDVSHCSIHCDHLYVTFYSESEGDMLVRTNDLENWDKLQPPTDSFCCEGLLSHNGDFYFLYTMRGEDHCVLFELVSVNTEAADDQHRMHTVWKQLPNGRCPIARHDPTICVDEQQRHLILVGGYDGSDPHCDSTSVISEYSLIEKNWVRANSWPKLPVPRKGASAVFLYDHVHLLGGISCIGDKDRECRLVLSLDISNDDQGIREWKSDMIPPTPVFDACKACKVFGTVAVAGGTLDGSSESIHSGVYVFDRSGRHWLKLPSMLLSTYYTSIIRFKDQLLTIGGCDDNEWYLKTAEQLSLKYFDIF